MANANSLSPLQAPGTQFVEGKNITLTHDQQKAAIESAAKPPNIYDPKKSPAVLSLAGHAGNTVAGAGSIVELARALKSNVDLIHQFVNDNIEYFPTQGLQKGGYGALIDGIGNAFDQADLMVQLLRQAGYTANYMYGELDLSEAEANAWLGTTTIWAARNLLANGGISASVVWNGSANRLQFSHCWVKTQISGTWYQFDPVVLKSYSTKSAVNLTTATGYNATTFMNNARSGATVNADYVQNMNRANIRSDLATMTANLVSWIRTNDFDAGVDDILGGRTINALTPGVRNTAHPKLKSGTTPTEWTAIPDAYKHFLTVLYDSPNINVSFWSADIYGKRLTLFFNGSHQAELRLDGTLIATSSAQGVGTWNSVQLGAGHPYGSTWANQVQWLRVWADKYYIIANAWGSMGRGFADIHHRKLKENLLAGGSDTSESVLGETLTKLWFTEAAQGTINAERINRMSNCTTVYHHAVGLVGHFDTPLFDIAMVTSSTTPLDNDYSVRPGANNTAIGMHGIAFEAAAIQQLSNVGGVSTTPLVDIANTAGHKIFDAKTANWTSVKAQLTNYAAQTLTDIENWWINSGYRVALPSNGSLTKNTWTGYGYYAVPSSGAIGIIGGGLKGGGGDDDDNPNNLNGKNKGIKGVEVDEHGRLKGGVTKSNEFKQPPQYGPKTPIPQPPSRPSGMDPVNLWTGSFYCDSTDFSVGSQADPHGLSFSRSYSSASLLEDGPLGLGWSHNFQGAAKAQSDGFTALGIRPTSSPIHSAAAIVEMFVCYSLFTDTAKPHDKFVTVALANQWFIDQLTNNIVVVSPPGRVCTFSKLPDGSYASPTDDASVLTRNVDGTYKLTTPQQVVHNFNSAGDIATIVFPFGVTLTYSYTAGKLSSVTNGLGRTLTLNYTGDRLTSVSDGTGRSVSYTIDSNKNLTQFTNTESKNTTYAYGSPGLLTQIFYPANPSTAWVTNTYDTLKRVKEQRDGLNNLWTYYIAGSRSEEVNPVGNSKIFYFNNIGCATRAINGAGKETKSQFDALGRRTKVTYPELNAVEYVYDSKHNILSVTKKAKPGSGLSDVVLNFTYHATFNKVATFQDALGRTTTNTYDASTGNLLTIQRPQVGSPPQTPTVTFTWNVRGQVLTKTDETGIVTQFTYDTSTEKLLSIVHDYGTSPHLNLTTSFGHNSRGDVTSITDPRGKQTTIQFGNERRMSQKTDPSPLSYVTNFVYNDDGRTISVSRQTGDVLNPWQTTTIAYSVTGEVTSITNPSGDATTRTYDSADRLWKITQPVTGASNRVWEFLYDAADRLYTVKDPNSVTCETRLYSDNGLLASVSDARSKLTQFTYDGHDRADRTTYADSSYEQNQSYDANGNVLTYRTRSGNTIARTFDALNREATRSPQGQPVVTMTYDLAGRMTKASKPVVSGDPSSGDTSFAFDSAGRFWKETYPDGNVVQHQLDANGNFTRTTWPDSWYVDRVFDELNRLSDIKLNGASTAAIHINWDPLSRRTSMVYENGVTTSYTHELDNDLATLTQTFVGSNVTFTLGYNKAHQMTTQQVSDAQFMWHPAAAGTTTYGAANNVNQYPTVGGVSHTYNGNGCLTGDGTWTWVYDTENHMTSASKTGTSITNYWDPIHRQREHKVGSTSNRYIYAGMQRIADYNGTTLQNRYVYGPGLDEVLIQVASGGTKTYYHQNWQGSVIAQTNSSGAVTNRYKYSAFGDSASLTGTTHGYTGQRYESESGLYYYKFRYYSPKLGRFLQPDLIGFDDGLNLYTYCDNDGLNRTDPLGLKSPPPEPSGLVPMLGGYIEDFLGLKELQLWLEYLSKPHTHQENFEKVVELWTKRLGGKILTKGIAGGVSSVTSAIEPLKAYAGTYVVYLIRDAKTGQALKIGQTKQFLVRMKQNVTELIEKKVLPPGSTINDIDVEVIAVQATEKLSQQLETLLIKASRVINGGQRFPGNLSDR